MVARIVASSASAMWAAHDHRAASPVASAFLYALIILALARRFLVAREGISYRWISGRKLQMPLPSQR